MSGYMYYPRLCFMIAAWTATLAVPACDGFSFSIPTTTNTVTDSTLAPNHDADEVRTATMHTRLDAFGQQRQFQMIPISQKPPMYLLRSFVSATERHALIWSIRNHPENKNELVYSHRTNRIGSTVSWMPHSNPISKSLARSAADVLSLEEIQNEELQVVQYQPQGQFTLHHDEQERIVTVLYYLNGIAGTWFPLASGMVEQLYGRPPPPQNQQEALQEASNRNPGQDGILVATSNDGSQAEAEESNDNAIVPIHPGDAIVFYNYHHREQQADNLQQDWMALHAGLPASEEKWIATHWFHQRN